ncbi:MAG TPA: carboxypeptidase regulatory-like domain-containing protein [Bryobacteraceae bacterium]|nr:carboxypeptidase regulatory-like domain-containing protein [Bryobacteraceae bacterium]
MLKAVSALMLLAALLCCTSVFAQAPTGIINGNITDETGAVIPNASITITNKATGVARNLTSNAEGLYSAPALPVGDYEVRCEAKGFRTLVRDATVTAGNVTQVSMPMTVGGAQEVVTVEAATAQINYDNNQVTGTIAQSAIQDLPLNGRSFMQLASLEPGVTVAVGSTAQFNALFTVSVLGAGNRTLFTLDGGSVTDNVTTASGITSMNFSQAVVQEFQISSVNFDLSTGIATGGAINVVTRSGSNDFHGEAYFFYRDHNMAAYPLLTRNPLNENPFFARRNPGASIGGPIQKDKIFFFFNYEHTNQVQALNELGTQPSVAPLADATYGSPYRGGLISFRLDDHLTAKHNLFLRYSHDGNNGFGPALTPNSDPSNWAVNKNWADQSIIGLTSTFTPTLVNDVRFQYQYWSNKNLQATASDCSAPCAAGVLPTVNAIVGAGNIAVGPNLDAPQARNTRRYEEIESLVWQKGSHRLKFGGDIDRAVSTGLWGFCTPFCTDVFAPEYIKALLLPAYGAATFDALLPTLPTNPGQPATLTNDTQVLNLPVYNTTASIFNGVGVGQDSTPGPYLRSQNEPQTMYRAYAQDTWKVKPNLTINFGLGWDGQTGIFGEGISFPTFLAPIFGANNLNPTANNMKEFQPAFGFAWSPFKSNKTVIRGGGGIYWDTLPWYYKLREGPVLGPLGDGRTTLGASSFTNIFATAFNLQTGKPIPIGAPLPISQLTNITLGQMVQIVNQELPAIAAQLAPVSGVQTSGPVTVAGVDVAKSGVEIYPPGHDPLERSYQTSLGVQQDLGHDMVLTADWARRQGENVTLGEIDDNHFNLYTNGVQSPVIPVCTGTQASIVGFECSTGAITVWTDEGRAVYEGLLVRVQKRLSHHFQFTASYALQKEKSDTSWYDEVHWMSGYGPILNHQNLNISGLLTLPWGFQLSLNSSMISRFPVTPVIGAYPLPGEDLSGSNQPLPGLSFNCLNSGCGKSQLAAALATYNTTYAGTKDANGGTFPTLVLPPNYALSSPLLSQDIRLTKTFSYKERYKLAIMGEMFNAFNVSNLTIGGYTLDPAVAGSTVSNGVVTPGPGQTYSFGQASGRVAQTFGSGGPRAIQVGARFTF